MGCPDVLRRARQINLPRRSEMERDLEARARLLSCAGSRVLRGSRGPDVAPPAVIVQEQRYLGTHGDRSAGVRLSRRLGSVRLGLLSLLVVAADPHGDSGVSGGFSPDAADRAHFREAREHTPGRTRLRRIRLNVDRAVCNAVAGVAVGTRVRVFRSAT